MSFCTTGIVALATTIYQNIGSPSFQSVGFISGWITNSVNLGDLNNKLSTDFFYDNSTSCICDDFGQEEANIYSLMYSMQFYEGRALATLADGGTMWTSISEGDTKISRSDMVNVSKQYVALQNNTAKNLALAINNYNRRISVPVSVDSASLYSYPSP